MDSGATPPPVLPDHELLRPIGRGSYGEVWLAKNMMGTYRAVKIVYRESFKDPRPFERELSGIHKFEPISRSHEGFVDVLQAGINESSGYFYYVMELGDDEVSGQTIDPQHYSPKTLAKAIAARGRLSVQETLELGLALSLALGELHKNGLVHRDIKPSNIIFVNGVPKLADIGLVAELKADPSYAGTDGFIPPEGPGRPQADVYALGKVLYEACTGKDRLEFPELPTLLDEFSDHELFLELNEVLLQACKTDVRERYASAWAMHADLLVLANGKSVKRLKLLERRWASLKRRAGIAALVLLIMAGLGCAAYREHKSSVELRQRQAASNLALGNQALGNHALESGDLFGSLPYFAEALHLDQGDAHREREDRLRFGSTHAQCAKIVQMWFARGEVGSVGFSGDGSRVLAIERKGKAQVYDVQTGQPVSPRFGQKGTLWRGAFSPDGNSAATACEDTTACIWHIHDGTNLLCLNHSNKVLTVNFSPDGSRVVTGCDDNIVRVWDARTGAPLVELRGHTKPIRYATFSPDGHRIVTASEDGTARVWDALDGRSLLCLRHPNWVVYATFSPDGATIATACGDHAARIWEAATGRRIWPDLNHRDGVSSVEFSPDGQLIATAGLDRMVRLWQTENHLPAKSNPILRHSDRVMHAVFSPDGRCLVSACADGTVRVWDLAGSAVAPRPRLEIFSEDGGRFLVITNHSVQVWETLSGRKASPLIETNATDAKSSQDGRFILTLSFPTGDTSGSQAGVRAWETLTGKAMGPPILITNKLANMALSRDGKRLLAFGGKGVQTWDVSSGSLLAEVVHSGKVESAIWSPSADIVASCNDLVVRVWQGSTGQELVPPLRHPVPVRHVEFSPNGLRLVTCGADPGFTKCWAQVWDAKTGQAVGLPMQHDDGVLCARFSADGKRVITTGEDFAAIVWDAETGIQLSPSVTHEGQITAASFSPDGQWFVTASADKTARVWDTETGDPLTPALMHPATLRDARFLSDQCRIMTTDGYGHLRFWELPVDARPAEDLLMLAQLLSGNTITPWGQANPRKRIPLEAAWKRLRAQYPADFTVSVEDIEAWHEFQAQLSGLEGHWPAAAIHLKICLALRPGDRLLTERLARAEKRSVPSP